MRSRWLYVIVCASIIALLINTFASAAGKGYSDAAEKVVNVIISPAEKSNNILFDSVFNSLEDNPVVFCPPGPPGCTVSPSSITTLMQIWSNLLIPFYVIAILFTALFFLIKAGSPRGRARARSMFVKLVFGMILVALSPVIYQVLLDTSKNMVLFSLGRYGTATNPATVNLGLVQVPLTINPFNNFDVGPNLNILSGFVNFSGLGCIFTLFETIMLLLGNIVSWTRKMMILFYATFFPLILFLYSFEITKPEGNKWLNGALKWIFVTPLQAMLLVFMTGITTDIHLGVGNLTFSISSIIDATIMKLISDSMAGMVFLAGVAGFVAAPLIITQLMSWLGNAVIAVGLGTGRGWMVGLGGLLAGGGSGAIIQADNEAARQSALQRHRNSMLAIGAPGPASTSGAEGTTGSSPAGGGYRRGDSGSGGGGRMPGPGLLGEGGSDSSAEGSAGYLGGISPKGVSPSKTRSPYSGYSSGKIQSGNEEAEDQASLSGEPGAPTPVESKPDSKQSPEGGFSPSDLKSALDNNEGDEAASGGEVSYQEQVRKAFASPGTETENNTQQNVDSESDIAKAAPSTATGKDISQPERSHNIGGVSPKIHVLPGPTQAKPGLSPAAEDFKDKEERRLAGLAADVQRAQASSLAARRNAMSGDQILAQLKQKAESEEAQRRRKAEIKDKKDREAEEEKEQRERQEFEQEIKRANEAETRKNADKKKK